MICGDSGAAASDGAARLGNVRATPESGARSAATHACNAWVIATWKMEERSPMRRNENKCDRRDAQAVRALNFNRRAYKVIPAFVQRC
jgi:hypothetical protein